MTGGIQGTLFVDEIAFLAPPARPAPVLDRAHYVAECEKRWHGAALQNARRNWRDFQELRPELLEALRSYRRDPMQTDIGGKCHNPDGTLTAFLWKLQEALQPSRSCLHPLLDFEEHFQKIFLRRGLIIYCSMILRELEAHA